MSWEKNKFGLLYKIDSRNGLTKPSKVRGEGYKMINMGELFSYDRIYDIPMELVPLKDSEKINAKIEVGDLLFARQSLVLEGAGKCSIVMETSDLTVFESHIIRVRLRSRENPFFYYYYFKSPLSPIPTIVSQCAQAGIRGSDLSNLEVICPPRGIQDKIVDILSTYDDLIEKNQKQIKLLEEVAQRLYKEWFIDLRFPGNENVEIVDGIPLGWHEDTIDTKVKLLNGFAFKSKNLEETGLFKLVTIKNVQDGYFEGKNVKYLSKIPDKMPRHCHLNEGDLLLSLTGNVGRVCMVEGNNFLLNQRVAKISSDTPAYTYCLFRSNDLFVKINNISNGAAQQNVSTIRIGQIKHWFPNDKLIMDFERLVSPILKQVVLMKKNIILLEEARDRLLPKLMSGGIEV